MIEIWSITIIYPKILRIRKWIKFLSDILLSLHKLNSDVNKNRQQSLTQPWIIWESIKSRNRSYKMGELLCSKHNSVLYFKSFFIKTTRWSIMVINFILRRMTRRKKKFYLLFNLMRFTSNTKETDWSSWA